MDTVLKLLEDLEEVIELSKASMFSAKVSVDKDEIFEIITEIRLRFPHELKQAKWVIEERNKILIEAQSEADDIIESSRQKAERLVDENEITRAAYELSEEILEGAKEVAKEIRLGANEYADSILGDLNNRLSEALSISNEQNQMMSSYYNDILEVIYENRIVIGENMKDEFEE